MKRHRPREIPAVGAAACLARSLRREGTNLRSIFCCAALAAYAFIAAVSATSVAAFLRCQQQPSQLAPIPRLYRGPHSKQRIFRCTEGASTCPEQGPIREGCHVVTSSQSIGLSRQYYTQGHVVTLHLKVETLSCLSHYKTGSRCHTTSIG